MPSLHDCLGHVRRVKARPLRGRFASLDTSAMARGMAAIEGTGEEQGTRRRARREPRIPQVTYPICARICARDVTGRSETGGRRGGLTRTLADRSVRSARSLETARDDRDRRRMAHNPEVAGSNPAPATKARGPFSNRGRASVMSFANGFVHTSSHFGSQPARASVCPGSWIEPETSAAASMNT